MKLLERSDLLSQAWGTFLTSFDPFTYLRMAEGFCSASARDEFRNTYPNADFSDQHLAIGIHTFRMLAAEALFLLILQIKSGRHILDFMKWCQGKRLRKLLEAVDGGNPPPYAADMDLDEYLTSSLACGLSLVDIGDAQIVEIMRDASAFLRAEAHDYLRTEPFNAIKHGGRFSPGFTEISIEMEPGNWVTPFKAQHGVTAYSFQTEGDKFVLESHSLQLDPENDMERIRGITSLLSIARTTRMVHFGETAGPEAWLYKLVENTPRATTNWRRRFGYAEQ